MLLLLSDSLALLCGFKAMDPIRQDTAQWSSAQHCAVPLAADVKAVRNQDRKAEI